MTGIQWGADIQAAQAAAKESGKLVLLHFWTPSCGPCRMLESQVFNQPSVAGVVHQKFVPVKVNAEQAQVVAQSYGVSEVPTDIVMTPEGKIVDRMTGAASPMAFIGRLSAAVAKHQSSPGAHFQLAADQSPYNKQLNPPYANLSIPPAAAPATPAVQQPSPELTSNPYAPQGAPKLGGAQQPPTPNSTIAASAGPTLKPSQPPANGPSLTGPSLPAGSPPLGFDGYCPVSMKQHRKWVRGDVRWGAIHGGRTYLFAGEAERDAFLRREGEGFSPVLAGSDPVLAIDQQQMTPGKREFGLEYLDSIYLFSSEETMNKFWANPSRYATGVRQARAAQAGQSVR